MDKKENIVDVDLEDEEIDTQEEEDCEDEVDMALSAFDYDEDGIEVKHIKHNKKRIIPNKERYKRQYLQDEWRARDFYERYGK